MIRCNIHATFRSHKPLFPRSNEPFLFISDLHQDDNVLEPVAVLDRRTAYLFAGREARAAGEPGKASDGDGSGADEGTIHK